MQKDKSSERKQTNLETANEMYKAAFLVKKTRLASQHPELTEEQLNQRTAEYLRNLDQ